MEGNPGGSIADAIADFAMGLLASNASGSCVESDEGTVCTDALDLTNGSVSVTVVTAAGDGAVSLDLGEGNAIDVETAAGSGIAVSVISGVPADQLLGGSGTNGEDGAAPWQQVSDAVIDVVGGNGSVTATFAIAPLSLGGAACNIPTVSAHSHDHASTHHTAP